MVKFWSIFFIFIGFEIGRIEKNIRTTRNCGRWSDIEAVKLPDIILGTAMLKKILFINFLKLFVTLVGCILWVRK